MKHILTHEGFYRGCDSRTPSDSRWRCKLRETKLFWISGAGKKFRKDDGHTPGTWPMYCLVLDSVKPLTSDTP